MSYNPNKTITANSKGIIISFRDDQKPRYVAYKSKEVADIQHFGKVKYQKLDKPVLNRTQQRLYSELLYGIKAYEQTELMSLSHNDILRITSIHRRVQHFLNRWKQEIMDARVDNLLLKLFPKSRAAKTICSVKGYNRAYTAKYSFKDLGLTQEAVANKFIEMGFLPQNFFQLV